jgi:hypothetical protein
MMGTTYQVKCDRCPKSYLTTDDTPPFWCGCEHDPRATCPECGKLFRPWPNGSIWCSVYCQTTPPPK